jgi:NO-binding membrane sensor protein with MHYT domain
VAISHRYDLKKVSLKSWITVLSSYVKIELFSHVYDARQPGAGCIKT